MSLSGQQFKELQKALISAFIDKTSLEQMLLFELDKKLREIACEGSLEEIIFKLIQRADSEGWGEDLISAARRSKPGNQRLKDVTVLPGQNPVNNNSPQIFFRQSSSVRSLSTTGLIFLMGISLLFNLNTNKSTNNNITVADNIIRDINSAGSVDNSSGNKHKDDHSAHYNNNPIYNKVIKPKNTNITITCSGHFEKSVCAVPQGTVNIR